MIPRAIYLPVSIGNMVRAGSEEYTRGGVYNEQRSRAAVYVARREVKMHCSLTSVAVLLYSKRTALGLCLSRLEPKHTWLSLVAS